MNKIAYIIAGASVLCFASCTHKQLGEVGMCEKDLLVKYNWEDVYEQSRGDFEDPMDNFLSNFDEIHAHVMPMSTVERIDTTLINDLWGTTRPNNMDHFKSTLFPSRSGKDRAHFAGIYDIFVTAPYDISQMINTTDMHNSIPTTFEFMEYEHPDYGKVIGTSTGINTKASEEPEGICVPGLNDLPYGDIIGISQLPRIYYGSKRGVWL